MSAPSEPRNPFYLLLLLASVVFVATALGYGLLPILEEVAAQGGQSAPPSPFRVALRRDGGSWLLWEVAAIVLLSLLSMGLDRLRTLKKEASTDTMPPSPGENRSP